MARTRKTSANRNSRPSNGNAMLLQGLFGGIVAGTLANVAMLSLGHSIWVGLLCHSLFGAIGMSLSLAVSLARVEAKKANPVTKTISTRVGTVRN
jgi:hypothetical protein